MTSLDDRLRDVFRTEGPGEAELQGDLGQVRAEVRRRTLRRRAIAGAAAAVIFATGGLLLSQRQGDDVRIDDIPPATTDHDPATTTTAPRTSTTEGSGTNTSSSTTSSTSTTAPSTTTTPPGPSMRDVDLGSATFANSCPGYDDSRSATLQGGEASLPAGAGATHEVSLGAVGYGDVDGDGADDAVLLLRCHFVGAGVDSSGELRAYRARPDGGIEQIGAGHLFEHPREPQAATAEALRITVDLDVYAETDPLCCPSSGAREVWRFDGSGFVRESSTPIAPPGAG